MSANGFGWVEIKEGKIHVHRMTPEDIVIVDKYENDEIVNKVLMFDEIKKNLSEGAGHYYTLMELKMMENNLKNG